MNTGHRIDALTIHYSYWNWTKSTKIHLALSTAYQEVVELFDEKRQVYLSSCVRFSHRIPAWEASVAQKERLSNGIIGDIYQHHLQGVSLTQLISISFAF